MRNTNSSLSDLFEKKLSQTPHKTMNGFAPILTLLLLPATILLTWCSRAYSKPWLHPSQLYQTPGSRLPAIWAESSERQTYIARVISVCFYHHMWSLELQVSCDNHLTLDLSTPIPKLTVATMTGTSPLIHCRCTSSLSPLFRPVVHIT